MKEQTLTAWSERVALARRFELLAHGLREGGLCPPWGTPYFQFDVFIIIDSLGKQDRGKVQVRITTTDELAGPVVGERLDPFSSRT